MNKADHKLEIFIGDPNETLDWGDIDTGKTKPVDRDRQYIRMSQMSRDKNTFWSSHKRVVLDDLQHLLQARLDDVTKAAEVNRSGLRTIPLSERHVRLRDALRLSGAVVFSTAALIFAVDALGEIVLVHWFILASISLMGATLLLMSFAGAD